ncbi:MAG: helix-turn-helix domain-containing protein [Candidatus Paceibacterota bacterium]
MIETHELEGLGLNDKEIKIYLASLGLGLSTIQNIAKKAGLHRVSAYDFIAALQEKGFINQIIKGKKRYFFSTDPEKILELIKDKEKRFEKILPELQALQGKEPQKPKVMYYQGRKAVWQAYFDRIRHREIEENLVFGSSEQIIRDFPKEYKEFTSERIKRGIKTRIIVERSESGLLEKSLSKKELREVKFLPNETKLKSNTIIYGNRVMIVSWESMMAVIVEDVNNAFNQKTLFNLIWKYLPE